MLKILKMSVGNPDRICYETYFLLGNDRCPRCNDRVYYAEKVVANGINWHKVKMAKNIQIPWPIRSNIKYGSLALYAVRHVRKIARLDDCDRTRQRDLLQIVLRTAIWTQRFRFWCGRRDALDAAVKPNQTAPTIWIRNPDSIAIQTSIAASFFYRLFQRST